MKPLLVSICLVSLVTPNSVRADDDSRLSQDKAHELALQAMGSKCAAPTECRLQSTRGDKRWSVMVWYCRTSANGKCTWRMGGSGHTVVEVFDNKEVKVHPGA